MNYDRRRRSALLAGVATLTTAFAISGAAFAQSVDANEPASVDTIVVTGSRIARPDLEAATPIAVVTSETIAQSGASNIQDVLRELPQTGVGTTRANSNFSSSGNGAATVDLRNLGPSRTLVLVNGRRFVPGFAGTSAVDLNNIPTDFIDRVEVVTGGASAVYGSDAISGVVNFILKDKFEGLTARAEYGISDYKDNERYLFSVTGGHAFGPDDRGHVAVNVTHDSEKGVLSRDRALSREDRSWATVGVPAYSSFPAQGRFDLRTANGSAQVFTFDHDNNVVLGFPQELAYNRNWDRRISLPVERTLVSANASYRLNDHATFFFEPTWSKVTSSALLEAYSFDWSFIYKNGQPGMPITNAYIPASIRSIIDARNSDANPANDITGIQFRRRQNEVYDRSNQAERETYRIATGVRGDLRGDWSYELSYVYGRMQDSTHSQDIDATKYVQALDSIVDSATNKIVCRDPAARAAGCVPINLFGFDTVSAESSAYVIVPRWVEIDNEQQVFSASATGGLFDLPAGRVQLAIGAEHRRERNSTDWDPITNAGNGTSGKQDDLFGRFTVSEVFGEVHVPLLAGVRFADYLGFNAAARYSNYSTVGGTLSWNAGLEYTPVKGIKLRANYAEANRAPNISELYAAVSGGANGSTVIDPCNGTSATSTRPQDATCRAIPGLLVEAADNGGTLTYTAFDINWMSVQQGGNPDLREETAKTLTIGGVYTPSYIPGFHFSADYFDIKIDNAIGALPAQIVVDRCISTADPFYCNAVERFPNGKLRRINTRLVNVAEIQTSGIDFNLGYRHEVGLLAGDSLSLNVLYTRLLSMEKTSFEGAPLEQNLGQLFAEGRLGSGYKNRGNARLTYDAGAFSASWQVTWLGAIRDRLDWTPPAGPDQAYLAQLNTVPNVLYHDLQVRYDLQESGLELYAGINNLFNKTPPLLPTGFASNVVGVESAKEYDPYGRRFFAGVRYRF